jgi:serine/threonine protein phosphatase 1
VRNFVAGPGFRCAYHTRNGSRLREEEDTVSGRIIAIGDIHGCAKALAAIIEAIDPGPQDTLVVLGDVIDRGPDSRGVLEQLIRLKDRCQLVPLLGNHEEMLLTARQGVDVRFWLNLGGRETLASYGAFKEVKDVPQDHIDFLWQWGDYYETETHLFVHAYYDPDQPLSGQPWRSLRWQSLPRDARPHCSGKVAIVGHTPQPSGEILDLGFLKCIDTLCHDGGWLTALEVQTGQAWQANQAGEMRVVGSP